MCKSRTIIVITYFDFDPNIELQSYLNNSTHKISPYITETAVKIKIPSFSSSKKSEATHVQFQSLQNFHKYLNFEWFNLYNKNQKPHNNDNNNIIKML